MRSIKKVLLMYSAEAQEDIQCDFRHWHHQLINYIKTLSEQNEKQTQINLINYHFLIYSSLREYVLCKEITDKSYAIYLKTSELYFEALFLYYIDDFESLIDSLNKGLVPVKTFQK
jgi:hypothetical protein